MNKKGVFIIESLDFKDEKENRYEGKFLSQILKLGGIDSEYFYIRTRRELEKILEIFEESEFRYLHFSSHGTSNSLATTIDWIAFQDFGELLSPYIDRKRLFISACSAVNSELAKEIFSYSKCYSLIGFDDDVNFDTAAILWASFYHLILQNDKMSYDTISPVIRKLARLYSMPVNYFQASRTAKQKFKLKRFKAE